MQMRFVWLSLVVAGCVDPVPTSASATDGETTGADATGGDGPTSMPPAEDSTSEAPGSTSTGDGGYVCGDGIIEGPEVCDDEINDGSYGGCAEGCLDFGPSCGDGEIDGDFDEVCDDGNEQDGDGCNADCLESGRLLWEVQFDGPGLQDFVLGVDVAPDGSAVTLAHHIATGPPLLGIRRFAADGSVVFNFDDNDGTRVGLTAFNLDEGEYGVLWSDNVVRAYDDAQSQLWDFSDMNVTVSYVVSDPGADAVYIVGSANGDAYYQQRDLAGAFRWEETVTGTSCAGVAPVSGDGALITCGSTLIRVDSSGAQMFTAAVPAAGIRARGDGTFVGVDGDRVVGFDADGTETWSAAEGPELLVGPVAADESGATVVFAPEGDGIRLAKLSPQGELWWTQLVESADTVRVNALDVGADGMIVLAGRAEIDPTHSEKWVAAFAP